MQEKPKYVIIPAGGNGSRMGGDIPKQMQELDGIPVLARTVSLFLGLPFKVNVIISINRTIRDIWIDYCRKSDFLLKYVLVTGGMTRFHSVQKTMKFIPDGALVAVHDAVRPLMPPDKIVDLFMAAEEYPAVVPVVRVSDSMRLLEETGSRVVDRDCYRLVQTPQVFHSEVLKKAYGAAFDPVFTDDASVVEKSGVPLHFCEGSRFNLKLTTPEDMLMASAILKSRGMSDDGNDS